MRYQPRPAMPGAPRSQRGLALFVALIVLVAMSLAGIALVRSVDTTALIAGNLAFRQSAVSSGDIGIEAARTWLLSNPALLLGDSPGAGYYATTGSGIDLTGNRTPDTTADDVGWDGGGQQQPFCLATDAATGNTVCYVIHRMCNGVGGLDSATCSTQQSAKGGSSIGATRPMTTYQERSWTQVATQGYYRVTIRIKGPRNNIGFVQAFIVV